MCEACFEQIQGLQQVGAELHNRGIQLVSITPDSPSDLAQAARQYGITTPLISDSGRAACQTPSGTFSTRLLITLAVAAALPVSFAGNALAEGSGQHVADCAHALLAQRDNRPAVTCRHDGMTMAFPTFGAMVQHMHKVGRSRYEAIFHDRARAHVLSSRLSPQEKVR